MDAKLRDKLASRGIPTFRWAELFDEYDAGRYAEYADWTYAQGAHRARRKGPRVYRHRDRLRSHVALAVFRRAVQRQMPPPQPGRAESFDDGTAAQELADVILAAGRLMGPHSYIHGFNGFENVVRDRKAKGIPTPRRNGELVPK